MKCKQKNEVNVDGRIVKTKERKESALQKRKKGNE